MTRSATITLTGPVGSETFGVHMLRELPAAPLHVVVDSHGGDTVTALGMFQKLRDHSHPVTVEILTAGSAATIVALGGGYRTIHGAGHFFVHRSWGCVIGTVNTLRESMQRMAETDQALAEIYAARSGLPVEQVLQLMDDETHMDPSRSVELGFCHEVLGDSVPACRPPSLQQTALALIEHVGRAVQSPARQRQREALPLAAAAAPCIERGSPRPKVEPGYEAHALDRFVENERREQHIRRGLASRLQRAITAGGDVAWPARATWTCHSCGHTNYHPPAADDQLASPCRSCGNNATEDMT